MADPNPEPDGDAPGRAGASVPRRPALAERVLFGRPALYRFKRFVIEEVIWRWILAGVFRLDPHSMPDLTQSFAGRTVLVGACGPGDAATGPLVADARSVTAFDLAPGFAAQCARVKPYWHVYCGDILRTPHRDDTFDVAVLYSTLHHVPAGAGRVLAELSRVTHGEIVLVEGVVPEDGLLRKLLLLWYRIVDGGHHYYTHSELVALIDSAGLRIRSSSRHGPIRHMWLVHLERS